MGPFSFCLHLRTKYVGVEGTRNQHGKTPRAGHHLSITISGVGIICGTAMPLRSAAFFEELLENCMQVLPESKQLFSLASANREK